MYGEEKLQNRWNFVAMANVIRETAHRVKVALTRGQSLTLIAQTRQEASRLHRALEAAALSTDRNPKSAQYPHINSPVGSFGYRIKMLSGAEMWCTGMAAVCGERLILWHWEEGDERMALNRNESNGKFILEDWFVQTRLPSRVIALTGLVVGLENGEKMGKFGAEIVVSGDKGTLRFGGTRDLGHNFPLEIYRICVGDTCRNVFLSELRKAAVNSGSAAMAKKWHSIPTVFVRLVRAACHVSGQLFETAACRPKLLWQILIVGLYLRQSLTLLILKKHHN